MPIPLTASKENYYSPAIELITRKPFSFGNCHEQTVFTTKLVCNFRLIIIDT